MADKAILDSKAKASLNHPALAVNSRSRNTNVKREVLHDLIGPGSPIRLRKTTDSLLSPLSKKISKGDSLPTTPVGGASPSRIKTIGVHIGFQLNVFVSVLLKTLADHDRLSKKEFLWRLSCMNDKSKSIERLSRLLQTKLTNHKFHAFYSFKVREVPELPRSEIDDDSKSDTPQRCIFPNVFLPGQSSAHWDHKHPGTSRWVAMGKIVGVMLSVVRYEKMRSLNEFRRLKFRNLTYN